MDFLDVYGEYRQLHVFMSPEKLLFQKERLVFQSQHFSGAVYVSLQECNHLGINEQ